MLGLAMKIKIIGASGTGKTTLATALAQKFQCAHFDSDDYYHYPTDPPYQRPRSPEDRLALLMDDLNRAPSWILSGGAATWDPAPPVKYSLLVFLYLPPEIRLPRVQRRELQVHGPRILPGGDMEADHQFFMKWTAGYDDGTAEGTNTLACHLSLMKKLGCPILTLDQPMTTSQQIDQICKAINYFSIR